MTPSELLVAAADRIRDLAAAATPGQWEAEESDADLVLRSPSADVVVVDRFSPHPDGMNRADARWIAALSPAAAGPALESFLRCAAVEEANPSSLEYGSASLNALMITAHALARALMAGETE